MIAHGFSAMLWPAILVVAAVVGKLALTCVIPFAAFAVATVGTLKLRSALRTMAAMWIINQAVGFGALGYVWTLNTVLWGLAIGAAGLSKCLLPRRPCIVSSHRQDGSACPLPS